MSQDPKIDDAVERIVVNRAESIAAGFQRIVQLVIGLGVVTAGVLFTLDNLGVLRARDYLRFWPIVFVAIGAGLIIQGQTQKRFLAGGFWVLLGAVMLSRRLGLAYFRRVGARVSPIRSPTERRRCAGGVPAQSEAA